MCSSDQPAAPAGKATFSNREHPEDGVLMNSSAYANKCRECAKTIDAGSACWCAPTRPHPHPARAAPWAVPRTCSGRFRRFDKAGEPGRKTTCTACHDAKAPPVTAEDEDPNIETVKKATKKRKLAPKARCPPNTLAPASPAPAAPSPPAPAAPSPPAPAAPPPPPHALFCLPHRRPQPLPHRRPHPLPHRRPHPFPHRRRR